MKKLTALLCLLIVILTCTTALGYGLKETPNGYYVQDGCDFTRNNALCYCSAWASVWHKDTGAYKNHYSTATINKESRNGTTIAASGRQWIGSDRQKTSSASCSGPNGAIYGGYGWWGGVY